MLHVKSDIDTKTLDETDLLTDTEDPCHLVVWNDEVNTFEWVIETLMTVCGHSHEHKKLPTKNMAGRFFIILEKR